LDRLGGGWLRRHSGHLLKVAGESAVQGPTVAEPDHLAGGAGGADEVGEVEDGTVEGSFGAKRPLGEDWSVIHKLIDGYTCNDG